MSVAQRSKKKRKRSSSQHLSQQISLDRGDSKRVRRQYRQLINRVESKETMEMDELNDALRKANHLAKQASSLPAILLDSSLMRLLASKAYDNCSQLSMNFSEYTSKSFIEKLAELWATEAASNSSTTTTTTVSPHLAAEGQTKSTFSLRRIGKFASRLTTWTPPFYFLNGPIHSEVRTINRSGRKPADKIAKVTVTKELKNKKNADGQDPNADLAATHQQMQEICDILSSNPEGMDFWKLVMNPHSFTQTIENIFHFSSVVQFGWSATKYDKEHDTILTQVIPHDSDIAPNKKKTGDVVDDEAFHQNGQCVVKVTHDMWKNLKAICDDQPVIPTRHYQMLHQKSDDDDSNDSDE
mmetsp:Transcript_1389/g.1931  ORF Transcript_1389/g.1931 Transcript_1389/m.1931 type:complete len:355 (-) Transcript_1389:59-1123(-)